MARKEAIKQGHLYFYLVNKIDFHDVASFTNYNFEVNTPRQCEIDTNGPDITI